MPQRRRSGRTSSAKKPPSTDRVTGPSSHERSLQQGTRKPLPTMPQPCSSCQATRTARNRALPDRACSKARSASAIANVSMIGLIPCRAVNVSISAVSPTDPSLTAENRLLAEDQAERSDHERLARQADQGELALRSQRRDVIISRQLPDTVRRGSRTSGAASPQFVRSPRGDEVHGTQLRRLLLLVARRAHGGHVAAPLGQVLHGQVP